LPLVPKFHHLSTKPVVLTAKSNNFQCLINRQLELLGTNRLRDGG